MATDATGAATSPDNIPTYNTAVDNPSGKGSNAQMAAIQTALSARVSAPAGVATGEGVVWNGAAWVRSSVTKLASGNFGPVVNADIDPAAAIAASKLASYPANGAVFLAGDGTWKAAGSTTYRKTTAKAVNTTIAATDLLNAEITIGAGVMSTTGKARLTANGDWLQNAGAGVVMPRFQLVLGGTTLIDTGANTRAAGQSATRTMWRIVAEITNTATNAQNIVFLLEIAATNGGSGAVTTFTTGTGLFSTTAATDMSNYAKGYNTAAVDTTASKTLVLNVINGTSNALYETKLTDALVEII